MIRIRAVFVSLESPHEDQQAGICFLHDKYNIRPFYLVKSPQERKASNQYSSNLTNVSSERKQLSTAGKKCHETMVQLVDGHLSPQTNGVPGRTS